MTKKLNSKQVYEPYTCEGSAYENKKNITKLAHNQVSQVYGFFPRGPKSYNAKAIYFSLLTLKKLSEENDQYSYVIPEHAKWGNLEGDGGNFKINIENAFKAIEDLNPTLLGIFPLVDFKDMDPGIWLRLVNLINETSQLNTKHPDFTAFIQAVLGMFIEKDNVDEISTPKEISELVIKILNRFEGEVYDCTSGINEFLIEQYHYAADNNGNVKLFGQEINREAWALGKMNFILHGLDKIIASTKCGNSITNPLWLENGKLKTFDGIASSPPFGLGNWGYEKVIDDKYQRFLYGVPRKSSGDWAFISHSIASLNETGKAVIVVPYGALFRGVQEGEIRKQFILDDVVEAVIGLPANLFNNTSIPVALLVINKSKDSFMKDKIFFIDAENEYGKKGVKNLLQLTNINKIVDVYHNYKELEGYSTLVDLETVQQNEFNLLPFRYFDKVEVETDLGEMVVSKSAYEEVDSIPIGDIADLQRGLNITAKETEATESNCKVINLADIDSEEEIIFSQLKGAFLTAKKLNGQNVIAGDILISSRGARKTRVVVIPEDVESNIVFSANFIRLRLNNLNKYHPHFVKFFLDSPVGQYFIKSYQTGSMVTVLSTKDIEKIMIPQISYEEQDVIANHLLQVKKEYMKQLNLANVIKQDGFMEAYQSMGLGESFTLLK
ncbi:N-6 DNA methylase [Oceanobacillus massiliensis]|uniref:N-6 DNA methylase n=1 Tax=Oceanobacillus massiliensis TaxID=1465765 RepID=UPI00028987EF|nr:N-6 DNA methylase [Oceanobacillus massiliensis]